MDWFEQTTAPVKVVSRHQDPKQTGKRKHHRSCIRMFKHLRLLLLHNTECWSSQLQPLNRMWQSDLPAAP